jgi:hypothetical protein
MTADTPRASRPPAPRRDLKDSIQSALQTLEDLPPQRAPLTLEQLRASPALLEERIDSPRWQAARAAGVAGWMPASLEGEKRAHEQATVDRLRKIRQVLQQTVDALDAGGQPLDAADRGTKPDGA